MTTLIFVRHGQSKTNLSSVFTGQVDTALTDVGLRQAENTARYLERFPIRRIYSSDLLRAMETARPTAAYHGLEVIPVRELREIDAGAWSGLPYDEIARRYPEGFRLWREDLGHAHPDGGEAVTGLAARIYGAVDRILSENRGGCAAIFTHATPMRMMGCWWYGRAPEDARTVPGCANASVSVAEYEDDGSFRLLCYGYDGHQGDLITKLPGL